MSDELTLTAYETVPADDFNLTPAPHNRAWMDTSHDRSAYRCLPMLMANQSGWIISNPQTVRFKWDGGPNLDAIEIQLLQTPGETPAQDYCYPASHFGVGIITWTLPYLFRTPEGYNLLVRGPSNSIKDGVAPLEGIVETDWSPATFTMNWKITRPDTWITFEKGEPLCMIVPQRRGELEKFTPEIRPLAADTELQAANSAWCASRDQFNTARKEAGSAAARQGWEKHYFQGAAPDGSTATEHQTRLRLQQFNRGG